MVGGENKSRVVEVQCLWISWSAEGTETYHLSQGDISYMFLRDCFLV